MLSGHKTAVAAAVVTLLIAAPTAAARSTIASERELLDEVNRVRAQHGLPALAFDARLHRAAAAHTHDMMRRGYFAHGSVQTRLRRFGVRAPCVGENLAWGTGGYGAARAIVRMWLASPGHRANLLRRGFRHVGLSAVTGTFAGRAGATVVTADFAGR